MTYMSTIKCDGCNTFAKCHPDEGPPIGWYLVAKMGPEHNGSWEDDQEKHYCSIQCVANGSQQLL